MLSKIGLSHFVKHPILALSLRKQREGWTDRLRDRAKTFGRDLASSL